VILCNLFAVNIVEQLGIFRTFDISMCFKKNVMKRIIFPIILTVATILTVLESNAQVAINTDGAAPNGSAMLDVKSTNKGILIPRVAGTGLITTPVAGLIIFNTNDDGFYYYDGGGWKKIATGTVTASQWTTSGNNIYYNTGSVAIGNTSVNSKAILDLTSNSKGILIPRMTEAQRLAITSPAQGLMVFQNDNSEGFYYRASDGWKLLFNSSSSSLPVSQGGTGLATVNTGRILYGSSATTLGSSGNLTYNDGTLNVNNGTISVTGTLNINGGKINNVTTITDVTTLDDTHNIVLCSSETAFTVYLPEVLTNNGRTYTIKNINSGTITIDPNSSEQIDGASTYTLLLNKSITIVNNGSAWYIIGGF